MRKRSLGKTGIEVSEIAFGGVEIGMPYGIGIKGEKDMLPEEEAVRLLREAVEKGINFFDTARLYGRSEEIMGRAFKNRRNEIVICTKSTHLKDSSGRYYEAKGIHDRVKRSLEESLRALQTDYVDVYMLHNADMQLMSSLEVVNVFTELKKSGKARLIAVSTYLPEESKFAIESGIWDLVQLPFNMLDQRQKKLFDLASEKGVAIVARSVLFKGLLSGRSENLHPELRKVKEHINQYRGLLSKEITSLSSLATKYVLSFKEVSSVLVGIDRFEYLDNAIETANGNYLNEKMRLAVNNLAFPNPEFLDLHHWDVMGWLK